MSSPSPSSKKPPRRSDQEAHEPQMHLTEGRQTRQKRWDAGSTLWTDRDIEAMIWIGEQYAVRLDHLQWILGRRPGRKAVFRNWISEGAARDVVSRWKRAGWAQAQPLRVKEQLWVWPTQLGLHKVGLPFRYREMTSVHLANLEHLFALNEIRLHLTNAQADVLWTSERKLWQGINLSRGRAWLHRPDVLIQVQESGSLIAIEAELSLKSIQSLMENMLELLRGEEYLRLKLEYGFSVACQMSQEDRSSYTQTRYHAPRDVCQRLRRARARLIEQGGYQQR